LQVGDTSRRQAAAPARDAGLTGFAAEGAKSAEAAQGHDDCSDDGRKGDYSRHDGSWKDVKNDDCQPRKDYCDTKPSDDCGKADSYRNPGEALAKIDFSRR
jgi:ATP-binding cassette subfamily B protein RaxB